MTSYEFVNDNVYGRIGLNQIECDIIRSPTFLRLGRIQQLGLSCMLFPGATHTRLSHSLGALHIMTKITRQLGIGEPEASKLRLAALLHDIGQYPLSHVIESVYRRLPKSIFKKQKEEKAEFKAFSYLERATSHASQPYDEAMDKNIGKEVIRKREDLQEIFKRHGIQDQVEDIIKIITGTHTIPLYKYLMDSDYDCDRLDSISRDAQLTGVKYGLIDLDYLIENLKVIHDPPHDHSEISKYLAVNKGRALHTLEHYLTARYYMYSQIIHHRTIKSLEMLAKAIFIGLADQELVYSNCEEIIKMIPTDEFLFFDDSYFFSKIFEYYRRQDAQPDLKSYIYRLIHRKPLKVLSEIRKLPLPYEAGEREYDKEYVNYKAWFFNKRNLNILCEEAGIPCSVIIPNENSVEFVPLSPDIYRRLLVDPLREVGSFRRTPWLYNENKEAAELLLLDTSSIIYQLSRLNLRIVTIYTSSDDPEVGQKLLLKFDLHKST